MFLKKAKDPTSKQFDDDEWIRSLTEGEEITTDVAEDSVTCDVDPKKVQPVQMGEFLRKYVSRRLLALRKGEFAALTTAMRQIGVGSQGGAEALAIFHLLLYDECVAGSLSEPLARIKVVEKFCLGVIEWKAVREATSRFLSKHTAAAAWKEQGLRRGWAPVPCEALPCFHGGQPGATLCAQASPELDTRERETLGLRHVGALIAAKPRFLCMIQDAATADASQQ